MSELKYVTKEYVSYKPQIADIVDPPKAAPVATRIGTTQSASVSFTPAVTGGTATSFLVTAYELPLLLPTTLTGTGASSPITVAGLGASKVYRFKVQGVNASGRGPVSYPSNSLGFDVNLHEDDDHDRTNCGERRDGHHYYWGDRD